MTEPVALILGFAPYGGRGFNPAGEIAARLDGTAIAGARVVGRTLDVAFTHLPKAVRQSYADAAPAFVLGLGLAPGTPLIRIERVAVNIADAEIPDNAGAMPADENIEPTGIAARLTTLPVRQIESALLAAGIPARVSNSAGTFVCNAALYTLLQANEESARPVPCGFLHLPYTPAQVADLIAQIRAEARLSIGQRADLASMSLDTVVQAVHLTIEAAMTVDTET